MKIDKADPVSTEDRLGTVLAACLETIDRGEADLQIWLRQYPDFAVELTELFVGQAQVERLAAPLRPVAPATQMLTVTRSEAPALLAFDLPCRFGDYELLEELGRGGMGVVFKARQVSLNRLVALKVYAIDPLAPAAERQRFRNEAELAAQLDHPNIVPIHEVGECAGRLYFSMKLLEGGNLATFSREPKTSAAEQQASAALVATVARAVHHAHQRGILHRDLKPANILLEVQKKGSGVLVSSKTQQNLLVQNSRPLFPVNPPVPYVSDFGLARRIDGDSGLTQSGAIIGTPGYMAPEQAAGQRGAITTATDVYGLGAILYALLTGRPPFQGDSVLDTLQQVRQREPDVPSSVNRLLNRDLETICLKCLEKEPARRYGSAEAVAEDLERWLRGEPIAARSISYLGRLRRWCRRNPVLAALLALVVLGSAASTVWIAWQMAQTRAEQRRAQQNLDTAYQVLDQYLEQVGTRLHDQPAMSAEDRKFLDRILELYKQIAETNSREPGARLKMGQAYRRVSDIEFGLGDYARAERANEQSVQILAQLAAECPSEPEYWRQMLNSHLNWGHALLLSGRLAEAEHAYRKVAQLCQPGLAESPNDPTYKNGMSAAYLNLGLPLVLMGRTGEAEQAYQAGIDLSHELTTSYPNEQKYWNRLFTVLGNMSEVLQDRYELEKSQVVFDEMRRVLQRLVELVPEGFAKDGGKHADIQAGFGFLAKANGRLPEAMQRYGKALELMKPSWDANPDGPDVAPRLAEYHLQIGLLLKASGQLADAESSFRKAADAASRMFKRSPHVPWYPSQLAQVELELGLLKNAPLSLPSRPRKGTGEGEGADGRSEEAGKLYAHARQLLEDVTIMYPDRASDRSNLGRVLDAQARMLADQGELPQALALLDLAQGHHEAAKRLNPAHPVYRLYLAEHGRLVESLTGSGAK